MTRNIVFAFLGAVVLFVLGGLWLSHEPSHIVHYEEFPQKEFNQNPILIRYNTGEEYVVQRRSSSHGWVTNVYNYNTGEYVPDPWGTIERDYRYQRSLVEARERLQQWHGK